MKQIRLPARQENLQEMVEFVSGYAEARGFGPDRVKELELAVEEALVNILTYAYPKGNGDVQITARSGSGNRLTFEIVDHGVAFDPLSLPVPDLLAELAVRRIGGLGVFFVRQMADAVAYRRLQGANVLTLTFAETSPGGRKEP